MSKIEEAGEYEVTITDANIEEFPCKSDQDAMRAVLVGQTDDGARAIWRGTISNSILCQNKTWAEVTIGTLNRLGMPENDLSEIEAVIGKRCVFVVDWVTDSKSGNQKLEVRFVNINRRIDKDKLKQRSAMLFGKQPQAATSAKPQQPPPPARPAQTGNPLRGGIGF